MEYILLFLILLNGMLFLSSVFKQKIEKMLFPLIVVYIIVLYIFGIMSIMNIGFWVLIASNIVMLVYNIIGFIKKKIDINKILTPGLIIFFICYVFFVFLSKGRLISVWDEFSHWALVTKNMFIFDSLKLGGSSNVMFDYFSGIPMFQYFCVTLAGSFTEKMLYVAQNVVLLSCLLPTLSMFENKKVTSRIYFLLSYF